MRARAPSPTTRQILPLLLLFVGLAGAAFVGYHIWASVTAIGQSASDRMAKKNVVLTRDGVRVGVRHREQESYVDSTQSWFVKAWNPAAPVPGAAVKRK